MNSLKCQFCGFEGKNLTTHLKFKHSCNSEQYRQKFGPCQLYVHSGELRKKISTTLKKLNESVAFRKRNSDAQKNGASCLTIKYWMKKGLSENDAIKKISELQIANSSKHSEKNNLQEYSHFCKQYWILKGYSEKDAIDKISNVQAELSSRSSKFMGHTHTDEENERISSSVKQMIERIGKGIWAKHFGDFSGRSKVEIQFYNYIKENIDAFVEANVPIGHYIVDVIKGKKIIEFYGDFWHANPLIFSEYKTLYPYGKSAIIAGDIWKKDNERISHLKSDGYDVLIVWESDWKKHRPGCVDKIKKYLL